MDSYTISHERLLGLLICEMTLQGLESAGVDNWEGYEDAGPTEEEIEALETQDDLSPHL